MFIDAEPSVQVATCAVTLALFVPSTVALFTNVTLNVADVFPAVMIVVVGTINFVLSLELRETAKLTAAAEPMLTDPAPGNVPALSTALAGSVTDNVAVSLS